jgi:hypothetical protein
MKEALGSIPSIEKKKKNKKKNKKRVISIRYRKAKDYWHKIKTF